MSMKYEPKKTDYKLSPYTGMTRESWIEAGKHLLCGIFRHIKHFEDPVIMPRKETEITYPHKNSEPQWKEVEKRAEIFEGLTRSLFIAAPLIKEEPDLILCGYRIADYYKSHILRSCSSDDPVSVGNYEKLQEITNHIDPSRAFQQTVETCALVIGLWVSKEVIWDTYTKEEKDQIASFLSSFAYANTVPQNWRLFNMLDMAFLHMNGYKIDKEIMMDHAEEVLNYYVGSGWYRDGQCFDYYSCWAFNVYGPLWNHWYGYQYAPEVAKRIEEHSQKLMETYPNFFDEDGWTNMWGRSNIYRCAAVSAFDGNLFLKHPNLTYGLARRICSGSLLQFLTREDFYFEGIPTMGFYRQFAPLVQWYSCAESPFWIGKVFLCLEFPKEHPFWTQKEENGIWEKLKEKEVKITTLDGPALCFSNHKANHSTILRTGKVVKDSEDRHGMWNYAKLSYHTKYPWESSPAICDNGDEVESQQYVLMNMDNVNNISERCNVTFWHGEKENVLYRRQFFNYTLEKETMWMQAINLADIPVAYGILRADKIRLYHRPIVLTLGAYGFPDNKTQIERQKEEILIEFTGEAENEKYIRLEDKKRIIAAQAIILKGFDSQGRKKQLAMTIYDGWEELRYIKSSGTNPESEHSIIVYARTTRTKQYGSAEPYMLISQVITKESHENFTKEELFPIHSIGYEDQMQTGGYGTVTIFLKDGTKRSINFEGIEGQLVL